MNKTKNVTQGDASRYAKPELTVFGAFEKLTAAGSIGPTEGQSGQLVKRP